MESLIASISHTLSCGLQRFRSIQRTGESLQLIIYFPNSLPRLKNPNALQKSPPHILIDKAVYFITSRTINKAPYFNSNSKKEILYKVIIGAINKFKSKLHAWVIIDNHYHALLAIKNGKDLPALIGNIHANSSRLLNRMENTPGRKIWWNYWDYCIRTEKDYCRG